MKIEEAIEELTDSLDESIPTLREHRRNAIKLSIEALRHIYKYRAMNDRISQLLLQGETEE